jgi:hypothetical protein
LGLTSLAAAFGIERRLIDDQLDVVAFLRLLDQLFGFENGQDTPLRFNGIVAQEARLAEALDERGVDCFHGGITAAFP